MRQANGALDMSSDGLAYARFRNATSGLSRTATAAAAALFACSMAAAATGEAAAPAAAASAAAPDTPGAQQTDLLRVVVTANKREQAVIDVPASVSAISGETLVQGSAARLEDYAAQVPGLSISSVSRGQTQVTLRGIGTGNAQAMPNTASRRGCAA